MIDLGSRESAKGSSEPEAEGERRGVFRRLRESLSKSRQALAEEISASFFDRIDEETWEQLEEALILADVGSRPPPRWSSASSRRSRRGRPRRRRGGPRAPDRDPRRGRLDRRAPIDLAASRRCC